VSLINDALKKAHSYPDAHDDAAPRDPSKLSHFDAMQTYTPARHTSAGGGGWTILIIIVVVLLGASASVGIMYYLPRRSGAQPRDEAPPVNTVATSTADVAGASTSFIESHASDAGTKRIEPAASPEPGPQPAANAADTGPGATVRVPAGDHHETPAVPTINPPANAGLPALTAAQPPAANTTPTLPDINGKTFLRKIDLPGLPKVDLGLIVYSPGNARALINGQIIVVGDTFDGYHVHAIETKHVQLRIDDQYCFVRLP
jgi:hypothetical protein